jgi:ABC-type amino acid transport system permease subunit
MLIFVSPTFDKSYTILSILLCLLLILTPTDHRYALLTFIAGIGLGYFLELWGTTRQCWTYYTFETPPLFAVLAHGMAAVAFWRAGLLVKMVLEKLKSRNVLIFTKWKGT